MKGQSNLLSVTIMLFLILGSIFTIVNIVNSGEFDMTYQVNASTFAYDFQNDSWETENSQIVNMVDKNDALTVENNETGYWVSEPVNTTENYGIPGSVEYDFEIDSGDGNLTVRSYDSEPSGLQATETIDFQAEEDNSQNIQYVTGGIEVQ